MPEKDEDQVTDAQEQTVDTSAVDAGQTASQDGDLALDPIKPYVVNKRTGKTATGSQIRDMFGEVELKRKVESENAKLKEELARIQSDFANMQATVSQMQIQNEVAKVLKGSKKQTTSDETFDWGTDATEETATPEIDPASFLNRIEDVTEKVIDKKVGKQTIDVKSLVAQELEQREEQQRQNEYIKQVFDVTQRETIRAFKTEMPDIPDEDIKEITEKMAVVEGLKEDSTRAFREGNRDAGADKWQDAVSLQRDIYNRLAELRDEQKQLERTKDRQKQLETISLGSASLKETKPEFQKTLNPAKASDNIAAIKKQAREMEAQLRRLRNQA